jgi:hypothetical protein
MRVTRLTAEPCRRRVPRYDSDLSCRTYTRLASLTGLSCPCVVAPSPSQESLYWEHRRLASDALSISDIAISRQHAETRLASTTKVGRQLSHVIEKRTRRPSKVELGGTFLCTNGRTRGELPSQSRQSAVPSPQALRASETHDG